MTFEELMNNLAALITKEQIARMIASGLGCEANIKSSVARVIPGGNKYIKIDVGSHGSLMVEKKTGNIYGIKAYGQIHNGHYYGTLDTTDQFYWGDYYPIKKGSN